MNIKAAKSPGQMTLAFEAGLVERYPSLRECVATGVYRKGLTKVAIDLDQAPSNLSVQLSADEARRFSIESFELYLEKTGDYTPIYYLVEKFLSDKGAAKEAALAELAPHLAELMPLLRKAGLA